MQPLPVQKSNIRAGPLAGVGAPVELSCCWINCQPSSASISVSGRGTNTLRLTKFEITEQGHFYTPNTHIGIGLSVLLAGRILYRLFFFNTDNPAPNAPQAFQSPLTMFFFGLIAGYYLVYYIGLFVHTHDKK